MRETTPRVIVTIEVFDNDDNESVMQVTVKPNGLGLGYSYTEIVPVNVDDWQTVHEIVRVAPSLPEWLKPKRMIDPDTN